jgi:hypothetical protein
MLAGLPSLSMLTQLDLNLANMQKCQPISDYMSLDINENVKRAFQFLFDKIFKS